MNNVAPRYASALSAFFYMLLAICASVSFAASPCPEQYAGGVAPRITNLKLLSGFVELCAPHDTFATGYSSLIRSPLYSAEHITATHVRERAGRARTNTFRPDDRLAPQSRAELSDFRGSRYDRGHLVPDADSWSDETEADTFVLSNMVPQAPRNNRGLHAHIEMAVRHFAKKVGDIYVITGPVFASTDVVFLNNRVAVPDHIFKLVYLPARHAAAAYYEVNSDGTEGQQYREISLEQLNIIVGMDLLPGVKNVGFLKLPPPSGEGVIGESN